MTNSEFNNYREFWREVYIATIRAGYSTESARRHADQGVKDYYDRIANGIKKGLKS